MTTMPAVRDMDKVSTTIRNQKSAIRICPGPGTPMKWVAPFGASSNAKKAVQIAEVAKTLPKSSEIPRSG
jgi:hypothetical protein